MPISLSVALERYLTDWRADVPPAWQATLAGVEPDLTVVGADQTLADGERIHPLRKGHEDPIAPAGSHPFKALDNVAPHEVRAVLVGQDPYPDIADATGRSFEQGGLTDWHGKPTKSLRRIVQVLAAHRRPNLGIALTDQAWRDWRTAFDGDPDLMPPPGELFDHWARQGVLCLNRGLTLSRFDASIQTTHMALWTPIIERILRHLVQRPDRHLILMLWGQRAQEGVAAMQLQALAEQSGDRARIHVVSMPHPAAGGTNAPDTPFFRPPDPFTQANRLLIDAGKTPIDW